MLENIFNTIRPGVDPSKSKDLVYDFGLDSFDIFDFMCAINEKYGVDLSDKNVKIDDFRTLENIEKLIQKHSK